MKRTILKNVGIGLCFLLSTGTVCAQNYPGKVKNAQGIEVTYQSNYKGKARPGHLLMTVSGDRVSLTNVWPEQNDRPNPRPEDKTPVTGSYIDYTSRTGSPSRRPTTRRPARRCSSRSTRVR